MPTNATETSSLLQRLLASPVGRKLKAEEVAEHQADRQSHTEAIALLEKQAKAELPALASLRDKAKVEVEAAYAAYIAVVHTYNKKYQQHQAAVAHFGTNIDRHRRQLELSADGSIDAFLERLADEEERLRKTPPIVVGTGRWNGDREVLASSHPLLEARLAEVRHARSVAQELKYVALDAADVQARLGLLWERLPDAEFLEVK
jgi:hypothetical protein